jgi:hypothetical protein
MHGGMLERDRSVGWRTGSTRVPLSETNNGWGAMFPALPREYG